MGKLFKKYKHVEDLWYVVMECIRFTEEKTKVTTKVDCISFTEEKTNVETLLDDKFFRK